MAGKHLSIPLVDLTAQYDLIQKEIDRALSSVLKSGQFIGGEEIKKFSIKFANLCNVPYCIPCANGTDALEIALLALGIGRGDEVIVPAFSFVATMEAVCNVGASPVLIDIDPRRFTLDAHQVERLITPKTKAIIPVHLYGQMADMDLLTSICKSKNIFIIEDAAQAHGAEYNGQPAGSIGDFATFSFYPSKNLGAYGDGGAITTNDERWYDKAYKIANHGRVSKYDHEIIGRNSRLDSLQAAILSVKLEYIREWNQTRQEHAARYDQLLNDLEGITLPFLYESSKSVYHLYVIRVDKKERDGLRQYLTAHGIETGVHYPISLSKLRVTTDHLGIKTDCPQAEKASEEVISLPMYPEMTKSQIEYVCEHIHQFFSR
jgi:dTDP-4-amino-4,6-dideoxygalactose transaminase